MEVSTIGSVTAPYGASTQRSSAQQTGSDFKALAQALQSGDLTVAQQAFSSLSNDSPWVTRALAGTASAAGTPTSAPAAPTSVGANVNTTA